MSPGSLWEERRVLANDFYITVTSMWSWGHNVQMKTTVKSSMTCMGVVLARMRQRSRRFQETDVVRKMKEFSGKVTSTWSNCGREREKGFHAPTISE